MRGVNETTTISYPFSVVASGLWHTQQYYGSDDVESIDYRRRPQVAAAQTSGIVPRLKMHLHDYCVMRWMQRYDHHHQEGPISPRDPDLYSRSKAIQKELVGLIPTRYRAKDLADPSKNGGLGWPKLACFQR
ncbi:hypothetical protein P691DRAFT_789394 [Macrolepiota fuliginosa MF-IS2]|uniref:Uncharacterized protein n=1 Tax=Macrolepiota fuliginosa MF-IS2 TaxID=1400762 RepID=A0A9P5X0Q8_9AGAR|nr:hypothetical protein P691DRAFT_789394 [Macrolepiota fuliginosa MF-IS2]